MEYENKEILQAVLIADNNPECFKPFTDKTSSALLPLVNVPLLDYALETLSRNGIDEVVIFSTLFINDIRKYIIDSVERKSTWSVKMKVNVIGGEDARCLGDALRDLDTKGIIRGNFILMGANTVTNANLMNIFEQHKKTTKFDKGVALTIVLQEDSSLLRTGDQVMIAVDSESNRLHFHQRLKQNFKEKSFEIPLETFLINSNVTLWHDLVDAQIGVCSPSFLSLFSDNFDFENRDDFIRGLLINEEILDSRIYVSVLPAGQYARKVSDWTTYQIVSNDIINRWTYPLVPDMGITCFWQNYVFLKNNIYRSPKANLSAGVLTENVVVHENTKIKSKTKISFSVIGKRCTIGKNCIIKNSYIFDDVSIKDNCKLEYCVIGRKCIVKNYSELKEVLIGHEVIIPAHSKIISSTVQCTSDGRSGSELKKIGEKAYMTKSENDGDNRNSDSEDEVDLDKVHVSKIKKLCFKLEDSDYCSSSENEEDESRQLSPVLDDTNIFLSEIIDSLTRGFEEKSNPEFLILEINSSRYAYNISLKEVNFYVTKAVFSLSKIKESDTGNVLQNVHQIINYAKPVIRNYIKTVDSMMDCLMAVQECFNEQESLRNKSAQIIHYLYDKEYVTEDAICEWYENLSENDELKNDLKKLIDWLMASSEEESEEEEE